MCQRTKFFSGTEIIDTVTYQNPMDHSDSRLVITNPIPRQVRYRPESAFGSRITFSLDNGQSVDQPGMLCLLDATVNIYPAKPNLYTLICSQSKDLAHPHASGRMGFRMVLQ